MRGEGWGFPVFSGKMVYFGSLGEGGVGVFRALRVQEGSWGHLWPDLGGFSWRSKESSTLGFRVHKYPK